MSSHRIFLIHKPSGPSSFDILRQIKKLPGYQKEKLGHFGTLDPFAEGLLLIGTGKALKLSDYIHQENDKSYKGVGLFGKKTASLDITEDFIEEESLNKEVPNLADLNQVAFNFKGKYLQVPPMYSAVKVDGKKLYKLARKGIEVERKATEREVFSFEITEQRESEISFEARVSKGTYIRTLFDDLCQKFESHGVLKTLVRTSIGSFHLDQAFSLGDLKSFAEFMDRGQPIFDVIKLKRIILSAQEALGLVQGKYIKANEGQEEELVWTSHPEKGVIGLAKIDKGQLKVVFNF